jgi:hypothetical protein
MPLFMHMPAWLQPEKQSFMRFAPAYFEHMVKMLSGQQTTLARILGVFTVHHKPAAGE